MKFSIVTPGFNSAASIAACVESVLHQSFNDYEHIIIDNLSTDDTVKIIRSLYQQHGKEAKLRVISEADCGISDAFNKGLAKASGEYILILNSDDALYNENILELVNHFAAGESYLVIHGDMYFTDHKFGSNIRAPLLCRVEVAMPYNHPGMFIHRDVYQQFGCYDTRYKVAMDYEFILRLDTRMPDFTKRIGYLNWVPLTRSSAGGMSWRNEQRGIDEVVMALKEFKRYNLYARYYYCARTVRTTIKGVLRSVGLTSLVKLWRRWKWGN
ncbi:hypothetical protein B7O87_11850 [Cylindrospermopsis raciborskii CENA303]|uniref:Glycosyltransferase 2-like domain-containing protein n=1 Tax=Cylindrospermopsis raciborskii CENA303 TaxID=1170769 RepID=A0A1X4G5S1_9CYAN|nr:glycosyltransferase family 2 protein [Cylindrospermopsis raciborskii]OSO89825.1 hypothetical protein B7O87_11850 [Cylindrospermopsis raciborskii CENA303]